MTSARVEDHFGLLADIGEISAILSESSDLQTFLDRVVQMVGEHLDAEVCSIYLFDDDFKRLVLRSTRGLAREGIGQVELEPGEGLVGKALKELRPICVANASMHPEYRHVPGLGEEAYEAFLAVPIQRGVERIGVLVVQRPERKRFDNTEVLAMRALTAQLATAIETARTLLQLASPVKSDPLDGAEVDASFVQGSSASGGYACGPCAHFERHPAAKILQQCLASSHGEGTAEDLTSAIEKTLADLRQMQHDLDSKLPEVAELIFDAHMMMLKDQTFTGAMLERISSGADPEKAVADIAMKYIALFEASPQDYIREKARDVEDLALRLLKHLRGDDESPHADWSGAVVVAQELLPSDILIITLANVAGIILVGGGLTSHLSIIVRSLAIPMIIAGDSVLSRISSGTPILLDADAGNAYIKPNDEVMARFHERELIRRKADQHHHSMHDETSMKDGRRVRLFANINLLSELDLALDLKAEGIGLYRTEFPFLIRQSLPSEEEQNLIYSKLLKKMGDRIVVFRTLDAGGDKMLPYLQSDPEPNPALGLRSTRLTFRHRELLCRQVRAILRAGNGYSGMRLMFPMICSLDEFREARQLVESCREALQDELEQPVDMPPIGMMMELPSVIELADDFAKETDFISIGTNDFIQYMLAVDRGNSAVMNYYCPHHPAVLRGLKKIAEAAIRHGVECSVCGEMAHDERYIPFFVGVGIRELSVDPHYLPDVQSCVMRWKQKDARRYADRLLQQNSIKSVEAEIQKSMESRGNS